MPRCQEAGELEHGRGNDAGVVEVRDDICGPQHASGRNKRHYLLLLYGHNQAVQERCGQLCKLTPAPCIRGIDEHPDEIADGERDDMAHGLGVTCMGVTFVLT